MEATGANLNDSSTLAAAFASAHFILAVKTMYEGAMEREVAQGKNIAEAAAAVETLEHFVWSTLPSASIVSAGKISVPHVEGKAQVDEYILDLLLGWILRRECDLSTIPSQSFFQELENVSGCSRWHAIRLYRW